jgi:predicted nucleotidyltransferase
MRAILKPGGTSMTNAVLPPSLEVLSERLPDFCRRHGIARAEIFGSVATGVASEGSDVDLMVTFVPGIEPGLEFFAMQDELERILGCSVDMVTRRSVERSDNPIRRRAILNSAREVYAG